ncbi:S1C family serine protease [Nostocoides japonicum]|uniref:S1C family serine protease n=1 Tax=Nostocoides japonicum TaxID=99481 RepID=UPI00138F7784|nr:serine protease [Tetrasphaera japonica]
MDDDDVVDGDVDEISCLSGGGSGVVVGKREVLTAAHVVDHAASIRVTVGTESAAGTVVGMDRSKDIALIRVASTLGSIAEPASHPSTPGDPIAVVGFAGGEGFASKNGVVRAVDRSIEVAGVGKLHNLVELQSSAAQGDSGAPVVDASGKLVGILQSGANGSGSSQFAIPMASLETPLEEWLGRHKPTDVDARSCPTPMGPGDTAWPSDVTVPRAVATAVDEAAFTLSVLFQALADADEPTVIAQQVDSSDTRAFHHSMLKRTVEQVDVSDAGELRHSPWIVVEFTTQQGRGDGPSTHPEQTCTEWRVRYSFRAVRGTWLIDNAGPDGSRPLVRTCSSPDD